MTPDLESLRRQAGISTTPPPAVESRNSARVDFHPQASTAPPPAAESWNSEIEHRIDQQVPEPSMGCGTVIWHLVIWSSIVVLAFLLVAYVVIPFVVAVLPWLLGAAILAFIIGVLFK